MLEDRHSDSLNRGMAGGCPPISQPRSTALGHPSAAWLSGAASPLRVAQTPAPAGCAHRSRATRAGPATPARPAMTGHRTRRHGRTDPASAPTSRTDPRTPPPPDPTPGVRWQHRPIRQQDAAVTGEVGFPCPTPFRVRQPLLVSDNAAQVVVTFWEWVPERLDPHPTPESWAGSCASCTRSPAHRSRCRQSARWPGFSTKSRRARRLPAAIERGCWREQSICSWSTRSCPSRWAGPSLSMGMRRPRTCCSEPRRHRDRLPGARQWVGAATYPSHRTLRRKQKHRVAVDPELPQVGRLQPDLAARVDEQSSEAAFESSRRRHLTSVGGRGELLMGDPGTTSVMQGPAIGVYGDFRATIFARITTGIGLSAQSIPVASDHQLRLSAFCLS